MVILYILAGYICLSVGFDLFTRRYIDPYELIMVFGAKGSGKTSYYIRLALHYLKKGWHVYTNIEDIMVPGVRVFNTKHLGDYAPEADSILLVDEAGIVWADRDYKDFKPQVRKFFKLQRHYRVKVYLSSQNFDVDKKLRDLVDIMYLQVKKKRVFSIGKRINKDIKLVEATGEGESHIAYNLVFAPILKWTLTYIPKYIGYYDSHLVPELPPLPYEERKKAGV